MNTLLKKRDTRKRRLTAHNREVEDDLTNNAYKLIENKSVRRSVSVENMLKTLIEYKKF